MAKKLTKSKARKILHDKEVHGHPLTEQQRKFFGAIAGGAEPYKAQIGTKLTSLPSNMMDRLSDALAFPQKAITQLFTGKYQTPSEAMNIQSPAGAIAADLLLDPVNLVSGAGFAKGAKAAKAAPKVTKFSKFQEQNPLLTKLLKEERPSWFVKPSPKNAKTDALEKKAAEKYLKSFVDSPDEKLLYETVNPKLVAKVPNYKGIGLNPHLEGGRKARKFPEGSGLFINPADKLEKGYNIYDLLHDTQYHLRKNKNGGWLDKYDAPQAQNGIEGTMGGLTDVGFNYNGAWGGTMQMGGVLPGAVGFTYARTQSPAPANGPYAKKTKASAQNGQEMKYYQEGLDFKPKTISQNGSRTPIVVSDPRDRRLTRYNDSLALYNNYVQNKNLIESALRPQFKKMGYEDINKYTEPYNRDRNFFELPDGSSTVLSYGKNERVTAPQYKTDTDAVNRRKIIRHKVGNITVPEYEQLWSTSIAPVRITKYNPGDGFYSVDKNFTGDIYSIDKTELVPYDIHRLEDSPRKRQMLKERAEFVKKWPYTITPSKFNYSFGIDEYVEPVQPVIYKPDVKSYTLPTPKEPTLPKLYKYDPNTPTKFSFTYPTGGYNEQKTMYFPSKAALKSFVGSIRDASYQEGKDYASATGTLQDGGDIPVDSMGYWNPENVGGPVIIPSNVITMEGVDQPLLGISDTGDVQYMEPGEDYEFDGEYVTEYPVAQKGKRVPIVVSDPKDPRLKAYKDSLSLYNKFKNAKTDYKNLIISKGFDPSYIEEWTTNGYVDKDVHPKIGAVRYGILQNSGGGFDRDNNYNPRGFNNYPTMSGKQLTVYEDTNLGKAIGTRYPVYKKPVQPVVYKKPEPKQEVVKKPEPVVEKKTLLTDYFQGTPIYAPTPYHGSGAGAFVGYRTPQGDTVFVKPEDYERMAVPKYGREFIESKKKMKNGGVSVNNADAQPLKKLDQLLNFTNYNKPTKGGWLDRYEN